MCWIRGRSCDWNRSSDIKPANVMVTDARLIKVLDFGLAKLVDGEIAEQDDVTQTLRPKAFKTKEASILGTAAYMAPEQARGEKVDRRSDSFSFGTVLYELATGHRAFAGGSTLEAISAILRDEPRAVRVLRPDAPIQLERIIQRCVRKDAARRFQCVDDVRIELLELKEDQASVASRPVQATVKRQHRLGWGLGSAALLAALWFGIATRKVPETVSAAMPLTTYPGSERFATFSPDGRQVAFSWDGEKQDNFDIYVKLIGTSAPLRITSSPAPDFIPHGRPMAAGSRSSGC